MIPILLLSFAPQLASAPDAAASILQNPPVQTPPKSQADPEYEKRKTEAGQDVAKLWKLYQWCRDNKKDKEGKATLKQLLKIDPNHREANVAAGNIFFDGKWFANDKKIEEYKKEKEAKEKQAQGLVEWKGQWVPKEDVPFLEKGLVKDDSGNWVSAEDAKMLKEGCVKQDLEWIPAAEKENIEKGLWKCGDNWLSLADADKFHSDTNQWWRIPFDRYVIHTTCDRDVAVNRMKRQLDPAMDDLQKIYGIKLKAPINVLVLRNQEQYGTYAAGADSEGLSSVHYAFFADAAADPYTKEPLAAGVAYWDTATDASNRWGTCAARHAIAQSFAEAIDPSPKALERMRKTGKLDPKAFSEEKRIPRWFRYGAASYVERYYNDTTAGIGGNPHWTKEWSVQNILSQGGLPPLKQIFDFNLTSASGQDGAKLINEAGLLIAFALDGKCKPVSDKLKAVQDVLQSGKEKKFVVDAVSALEVQLTKNEAELRKFAGL